MRANTSKPKKTVKRSKPAMSLKEFNKLDKFEKRVVVAKDVLAQLKVGKFKASRGTYFGLVMNSPLTDDYGKYIRKGEAVDLSDHPDKEMSAKEWLHDDANKCHVCAKGALVCSAIRTINKRNLEELEATDPELIKIFGVRIWDEIEAMFEGWNLMVMYIGGNGDITWEEKLHGPRNEARSKFFWHETGSSEYQYENYKRAKTPLEDIMKNIIKHDGRLKTQKGIFLY